MIACDYVADSMQFSQDASCLLFKSDDITGAGSYNCWLCWSIFYCSCCWWSRWWSLLHLLQCCLMRIVFVLVIDVADFCSCYWWCRSLLHLRVSCILTLTTHVTPQEVLCNLRFHRGEKMLQWTAYGLVSLPTANTSVSRGESSTASCRRHALTKQATCTRCRSAQAMIQSLQRIQVKIVLVVMQILLCYYNRLQNIARVS
jgi:hypothetical protein